MASIKQGSGEVICTEKNSFSFHFKNSPPTGSGRTFVYIFIGWYQELVKRTNRHSFII